MNPWIIAIPIILPALLMVAAHYFPWHTTPLGKLSENQARIYGVSCIIGTTMLSVALGESLSIPLTAWQTIGLIWLSAFSAGAATIWAWSIDAKNRLHQDITAAQHRNTLLREHAETGDFERLFESD